MLIYNLTYHIETPYARNFYIWMHEVLIPEVEKGEFRLKNPRVCRILGHRGEEEGESYTLQWEVEDSAELHRWHLAQGRALDAELQKLFQDHVVVIPTLMEVIPY